MPATPRALVVLNARSGTGCTQQRADELRELFAGEGLQAEIVLAQGAEEMFEAVDSAEDDGYGLVVAGGGDGTQSAVASRVAGTELVQGVLPLGTLNHFAKDLGIPLKVEEAIRTLATGRVQEVDVGEVNGRTFINNSSLGLYPQIVRERELQQMHLGKSKWRALASAVLHATQRRTGMAVRVESPEDQQLRRTPFVFVGNNRYVMEGLSIGAREALDRGELALYMGKRRGRLALVRLALHALTKTLQQAEDFEMLTGPAFVVDTAGERIRVATDGEVCMMDSPLSYRIRPRALRVMVPAAAAA